YPISPNSRMTVGATKSKPTGQSRPRMRRDCRQKALERALRTPRASVVRLAVSTAMTCLHRVDQRGWFLRAEAPSPLVGQSHGGHIGLHRTIAGAFPGDDGAPGVLVTTPGARVDARYSPGRP